MKNVTQTKLNSKKSVDAKGLASCAAATLTVHSAHLACGAALKLPLRLSGRQEGTDQCLTYILAANK